MHATSKKTLPAPPCWFIRLRLPQQQTVHHEFCNQRGSRLSFCCRRRTLFSWGRDFSHFCWFSQLFKLLQQIPINYKKVPGPLIVSDTPTPERNRSATPNTAQNKEGPEDEEDCQPESAPDQRESGGRKNCSWSAANSTADQMLVIEKSAIDLIPLQSLLSAMLAALAAAFMVVGGRSFVWKGVLKGFLWEAELRGILEHVWRKNVNF